MDAPIPCTEPDTITAGDTATWERSLDFYPAGQGWTLSYALSHRQKAGEPKLFTATANGDKHLVVVPAGDTATWLAGTYTGQAYVTKAGARYRVWEGLLEVRPNLQAGNAGDQRTHARIVLDNVQAVLEKRATQQMFEFTVEGVAMRKLKHSELLALRDRYAAIVLNEEAGLKIAAGRATGRRILTRFVKPT